MLLQAVFNVVGGRSSFNMEDSLYSCRITIGEVAYRQYLLTEFILKEAERHLSEQKIEFDRDKLKSIINENCVINFTAFKMDFSVEIVGNNL